MIVSHVPHGLARLNGATERRYRQRRANRGAGAGYAPAGGQPLCRSLGASGDAVVSERDARPCCSKYLGLLFGVSTPVLPQNSALAGRLGLAEAEREPAGVVKRQSPGQPGGLPATAKAR